MTTLISRTRSQARRVTAAALITLVVPAALAACSSDDTKSAASNTSTASAGTSPATGSSSTPGAEMASQLQATDPWAKAADSGMSAAFGTLKNTGMKPVVITGARGDAGPVQLHVTQKTANGMEMKETKAFTVPAGGSLELKPGSNHLMFMDLRHPMKAGETQKLTITFEDGSHTDLTFPVRAYDGAKEKYAGSSSSSDGHSMSGMDMNSSDAHSSMSMSGMASHSH